MFVCFWTQGREKFTSCVQHEDRARSVKLILRIKIHWFLQMCADTGWGAGKGVKCQRSWRSLSLSARQVINVDDDGNELGSGVMELTDAELVLHTHRRDDVRWPYLCLRRYGYDSNLFSFESGRRCQTGQGKNPCVPTGNEVTTRSCVCVCWLKVFLVSGLCLAMIRCQEGGVGGAVRSGGLVSLSRMSFVLPRPRSVLISCRWTSVWVKTCLQCVWCVIHLALVPVRSQQNHQNDPDQ